MVDREENYGGQEGKLWWTERQPFGPAMVDWEADYGEQGGKLWLTEKQPMGQCCMRTDERLAWLPYSSTARRGVESKP